MRSVLHLKCISYVSQFEIGYSDFSWILIYRKSSGFSRGASIYRGVTRSVALTVGLVGCMKIMVAVAVAQKFVM